MYLIRVLFFVGDVIRFNVSSEHVPDCLGRG